MPKVVREDIDKLNTTLTVSITHEDYAPKLKEELKKLREKAAVKGFRKGKTPDGFLKRMHGKGLLSDIVTKILQGKMSELMADENFNFLGQPISTEDHPVIDFKLDSTADYVFKFDVGLAPEFEIAGLDEKSGFEFFKVAVSEEKVNERLEFIRKKRGTRVESETTIREEDLITLNAAELEGGQLKADGWKTTFSILMNRVVDEDLKKELATKKKGDTVRFNVYHLEEDSTVEQVKKYLLKFTDDDIAEGIETGEMFEAVIEKVTYMAPAELNQEFFDPVFGQGVVSSVEEAKEILAESLGGQERADAESLLYREFHKQALEKNRASMPLPEGFLKRWVHIRHEKGADKILNDFEKFCDDLRWSLIKNKLYKQFGIHVKEGEVRELATHRVAGYFGGYYQGDVIKNYVDKIMADPDQVNSLASEVLSNKLFYALRDTVKIKEVTISPEELNEKMEALEAGLKATEADEQVISEEVMAEEVE